MKLVGPERYELTFTPRRYTIATPSGDPRLSRLVQARRPKLYVVASGRRPVYVGITNQPIRARLRLGWSANGSHGYYGYAFRRHLRSASLFVWFHPSRRGRKAIRDLETIEAEVAYLIRKRGQWPEFQTEIHFYPSGAAHRRAARAVVARVRARS